MSILNLSIGSFELTSQIHLLRQKVAAGEATREDMRAIHEALRGARASLPAVSGGSRTTKAAKAKAPVKSGDDLLGDFESA